MSILEKLKAILVEEESPFQLAVGELAKIEVARSGKFRAKVGGKADLTPEDLAFLAEHFDTTRDHKLKLGHKPIDTDTPDMGDVVGLEHDPAKDRLYALISPTEAMVEKNRKGEFRRVSMELARQGDRFTFEHLAFLGAHRPAIVGLAPVELAEGCVVYLSAADDDELDVELADFTKEQRDRLAKEGMAMPDGSYPIRNKSDLANAIQAFGRAKNPDAVKRHIIKRARALGAMEMLPESWGKVAAAAEDTEEEKVDARRKVFQEDEIKEKTEMADEAALKKLEDENKAKTERLVAFAKKDVEMFLASDAAVKRIPLAALKSGNAKTLLAELATMEAEGEGPIVKLANSDGKETEGSLYELAKTILLSMPEKIAASETEEIAKDGHEEDQPSPEDRQKYAGADPDSIKDDQAAQKLMFAAKSKGETLTYFEALRQVEMARSK